MKLNLKNIVILCTISLLIVPAISSLSIENNKKVITDTMSIGSEYQGHLRIYIAEIESRWDMYNGAPYHYAFMDFAFNDEIEIAYLDTYTDSITWQGDIEEGNIMIFASIFNSNKHTAYGDPPEGRPYDAYYVDAAAGCEPGQTDTNVKNEEFTHTVFCEVATATWCQYCPYMADELDSVYRSGDYPFYYIEMVTDVGGLASSRVGDFNLAGYPSAFYDGGYQAVVGGGAGSSYHKDLIEDCGEREIHDLDLILSAEWIGEGAVTIDINITNNEELSNRPPEAPTITGPEDGKPGESYEYDIRTTDPDDDDVSYLIDWGDGSDTGWIGPHASGQTISETHTWDEEGTFIIKVKAKDPDGAETDWTWLRVSVPKGKIFSHPFFEWFFSQFSIFEKLFN